MLGRRFLLAAAAALFLTTNANAQAPTCVPIASRAVAPSDIQCALSLWYAALNRHDAVGVTGLYARENVLLLSTLDAAPYTNDGDIGRYFGRLVLKPRLSVVPRSDIMRDKIDLFGGGGAISGFYEFRWFQGQTRIDTPARFTFVYRLEGQHLIIATHHSSKIP